MQYFCDHTPGCEAYFLRQMDMGSLTCAQIWVRAVHTKRVQAQRDLHKSRLGGTEKLSSTLSLQGIEPMVFGFYCRLTNPWCCCGGGGGGVAVVLLLFFFCFFFFFFFFFFLLLLITQCQPLCRLTWRPSNKGFPSSLSACMLSGPACLPCSGILWYFVTTPFFPSFISFVLILYFTNARDLWGWNGHSCKKRHQDQMQGAHYTWTEASALAPRSGVLRMQKLRTPLVRAKGYRRFPLFKPGVGI